jgi:hypothetical protein
VPGPFRLAVADPLLPPDEVEALRSMFHGKHPWDRHEQHFYRCDIVHVHRELSASRVRTFRQLLADAVGLPLCDEVTVTAQRMHRGDGSDRHTDAPLAGYECARLIVQLDDAEGGRFRAFADADTPVPWVDRAPRAGGAVAMELSTASHHDVTDCATLRRTVVVHGWHVANPVERAEQLTRFFAGWSPADLPADWDDLITDVEATVPDEVSLLAAAVAWAMLTSNAPEPLANLAYRWVACGGLGDVAPPIAAWHWLTRLHLHGFDREAYDALPPAARAQVRQPWP